MNIEVIGIDHIYVSVTDLARSEAFYDRIMPVLGFLKNSFRNEVTDTSNTTIAISDSC